MSVVQKTRSNISSESKQNAAVTWHTNDANDIQGVKSVEDSRHYQFDGLRFQIRSNCQMVYDLFDEVFEYFYISQKDALPDFTLNFHSVSSLEECDLDITKAERIVESWDRITFLPEPYPVLFRFNERVALLKDITQGETRGYFKIPYRHKELRHIHGTLLLPAVANMLWMHGRFYVHAAAVATNGKGVVLSGASGSGKTTLLLLLLHAGCQYLSDDILFLRQHKKIVTLLSVPTKIRVTPQALSLFPALRSLISLQERDQRGKYRIAFSALSSFPPVMKVNPEVLLFPEVTPNEKTRMERISSIEAATRLIPDSLIASQMPMSLTHLAVLSDFLQHVTCYRVYLGQQMDSIVPRILEVLSQHV